MFLEIDYAVKPWHVRIMEGMVIQCFQGKDGKKSTFALKKLKNTEKITCQSIISFFPKKTKRFFI